MFTQNSANNSEQPFDTAALLPTLDVQAGLRRLNNNKKIYKTILSKFSAAKMTGDIADAIRSGNASAIASAAHALKGVGSNLGFDTLTALSLKIEAAAKAGEPDLTRFIAELDRETSAAIDAVTRLVDSGALNA